MSIDSIADWEGLRQVARIARITLDAVAPRVRLGVTTGELDATAARLLTARGARPAPAVVYGFPGTILISAGSARVVQGADGWTLRTRDGSLSAHHEHTLVITRGSPIVLTATAA